MRRVLRALLAVLVVGLSMSVPAAQALAAPADPPGETCYHFPLITVCCGGGGCHIL
jgi:hypothetical protein